MLNLDKLNLEDCRGFYADEVRFIAELSSPALVGALARVPREKFLGPGPWQIGSPESRSSGGMGQPVYVSVDDPRDLYHNVLVGIDRAKSLNNGQPSALARWIGALELKAGERVYHLGCGVGYYTAIMAEVVGPGGSVVTSEVDLELAARARENLSDYANVTVHAGDGADFDPGDCDAIFINAGVTHPHAFWLDRLREGGRLMLPITMSVSPTLGYGLMTMIVRRPGGFAAQWISRVGIFSCTSVRDPELEPLIKKAFTTQTLLKVKSLRRDTHEVADTCLVHASAMCLSSAELA
ncbi:MAG TPA: methyltransferase domain-containing protein [Candidatus Angelobacter sp.]